MQAIQPEQLWEVAYKFARQEGLQPADCNDVAQETLVALLEEDQVIRTPPAWVRDVARRKAIDVHRRRSREAITDPTLLVQVPGGETEFSRQCDPAALWLAAYLRAPKPTANALASWAESLTPGNSQVSQRRRAAANKRHRAAAAYLRKQADWLRCGNDPDAFGVWAQTNALLLSLADLPRFSSLLGWLLRVAPRTLEFALAAASNEPVKAALRMEAADLVGDFKEALVQADHLARLAGSGGALALTDAARVFANAARDRQARGDSTGAHWHLQKAEWLLDEADRRWGVRGRAELTFQIRYNRQIVANRMGDFLKAKNLLTDMELLPLNGSRRGSVRLQWAETLLHRYQSGGNHLQDLEEARTNLAEAAGLLGKERFNRRVAHAQLCRARVLRQLHGNTQEVFGLAVEAVKQYRLFGCMRYVHEVTAEFGFPPQINPVRRATLDNVLRPSARGSVMAERIILRTGEALIEGDSPAEGGGMTGSSGG